MSFEIHQRKLFSDEYRPIMYNDKNEPSQYETQEEADDVLRKHIDYMKYEGIHDPADDYRVVERKEEAYDAKVKLKRGY